MRNLGSEISGQKPSSSQIRFVKIQEVGALLPEISAVWDLVFYGWTEPSDFPLYDFLKASNIRAETR